VRILAEQLTPAILSQRQAPASSPTRLTNNPKACITVVIRVICMVRFGATITKTWGKKDV
jgi:hypothetical protein